MFLEFEEIIEAEMFKEFSLSVIKFFREVIVMYSFF